ncbi:chain-length determining protein [Halioglobus maricola]|uniref:Chain-length determining protein n=1 Tax=Halioglobus maricola TaxID=2601894 RepID=A0A5P9NQM0_9GAMM|nr:chain-length determining protein [Halioglobus maricola]QFU77168.1 chain-length determining protein [Halioglobus maricola]
MNSDYDTAAADAAVMHIDLMPYVNALIDARWWLLGGVLCAAALTAWWAYSSPYMYQSSARVSIVDIEDPGGVSPDDRRASEVLTLVEHGFVMGTTHDNYNDVMLARLSSRDFTMRFLAEHKLDRHFYPEFWDEQSGAWINGFEPDRGAVFTRFRDEVRTIDVDEETDIVAVGMVWADPVLARDWANLYVAAFNEFIRGRTLADVARKQAYLENELQRADVVDIQQSIYRLIEAQAAISMLANAREEYALEIIDPAALPYRSFNLSRKRKVLFGAIAGLLVSVFLVFARLTIIQMLNTILAYRREHKVLALQKTEENSL